MPNRFFPLFCVFIFCLINTFFLHSQTTIDYKIQSILTPYCDNAKPGCAITVLQNNEPVFAKAYGLANLEHDIAFTSETVSDIGSLAKQITCFAVLLLEAEGRLSVEDDIHQYLEDIPDFGTSILIRHLMSHTSGLREIYGARAVAGGRTGDGILQEDALRLVQYSKELNFPTGTEYNYCNTAYMLLADIVTKVSGQSFEDFLRKRIFEPLGMHHTYVMNIQGECFPKHADSYRTLMDGGFQKIYDNSTVQGAGGIYTSMEDLTKWAQNLMDPNVGSQAIIDKMRKPATLNDGTELSYGYGLQVGDQYGLQNFRHSGSSAGYRAWIAHYEEDQLTVLIKTNNGEIPIPELNRTILQHYTKVQIETPTPPQAENTPTYLSLTDAEMKALEGTYFSAELDMMYTIKKKDQQLFLHSLRNGDILLHKTNKTTFTTDEWYLRALHLEIKKDKVQGFRVDNGRVMGVLFAKL